MLRRPWSIDQELKAPPPLDRRRHSTRKIHRLTMRLGAGACSRPLIVARESIYGTMLCRVRISAVGHKADRPEHIEFGLLGAMKRHRVSLPITFMLSKHGLGDCKRNHLEV